MKKIILIVVSSFILSIGASAQAHVEEMNRRQEAKVIRESDLQKAADQSGNAKALKAKIDAREDRVIIPAARTGDTSLIPYLKLLAVESLKRSQQGTIEFQAHIALAILGYKEAYDQIINELDQKNHATVLGGAISKLALIVDKAAYRILYELLDDEFTPHSNADDMIFVSMSRMAMSALASIVDNPPTGRERESVDAWKAWFEKNRHLID